MLDSFLWTNESFSLWNCLSRNSTLFSSQRRAWLVLSQSRQRGFWRNLRYILYSVVKKSSFLKGNFHGCFLHFDFGVKGKPHHKICPIWNWFYVASADVTCVNVSTVQLVLCELLLRINSWVFENKFSRNHFKSSFKLPVGLIYFRPIWGGLNRDRGLI